MSQMGCGDAFHQQYLSNLTRFEENNGFPIYSLDVRPNRQNSEEFEQLAMPLFAALYNLAHWLTRDRGEAEDLVQETYTKALKGFSSFQSGTNFKAWIYRILRNSFLTSRSGLKQSVSLDEEEDSQSYTP